MMRTCFLVYAVALLAVGRSWAAPNSAPVIELRVDRNHPGPMIDRNIFGQSAEHLGSGIYGGIWVGRDAPIPNVRGIRSDVLAALRELHVPNVRWPGVCFGDEYHWRDGIGPAANRRATVLTAAQVDSINSFESAHLVQPTPLDGVAPPAGLMLDLPAKSVSVLQFQ